jgi:hypothetical protein
MEAKVKKTDKQRIRSAALQMDKPFTVTVLKMRLPDLVFGSAAPKGKDWRDVLDRMVAEGVLVVHSQGASIPVGGGEFGKLRQYVVKEVL